MGNAGCRVFGVWTIGLLETKALISQPVLLRVLVGQGFRFTLEVRLSLRGIYWPCKRSHTDQKRQTKQTGGRTLAKIHEPDQRELQWIHKGAGQCGKEHEKQGRVYTIRAMIVIEQRCSWWQTGNRWATGSSSHEQMGRKKAKHYKIKQGVCKRQAENLYYLWSHYGQAQVKSAAFSRYMNDLHLVPLSHIYNVCFTELYKFFHT